MFKYRYDYLNYILLSKILLENFEFIETVKDVPNYARVVLVDLLKINWDQTQVFKEYLDAIEQQKLHKISIDKKRLIFIVCRFVTKRLIGEFFDLDPLTLKFHYTERGKPYVQTPGVEFNISHSGDYALIGVSRFKIGVDIERMKQNRDFEKLAEVILTSDEKKWVFEKDIEQRFYTLWTLKEARLKCDGDGLSGIFPDATHDIVKGWGYKYYEITSNAICQNYFYTICIKI